MKKTFTIKTTFLFAFIIGFMIFGSNNETQAQEIILPDPLLMEDGRVVDSVYKWEDERRREILDLFQENQHGITPTDSINITYEVVESGVLTMGGNAKRTQIRLKFPDYPDMNDIRVCISVPAYAKGPVPTLLHISFSPNVLHYADPGIDTDSVWRSLGRKVPDSQAGYLHDIFPEQLILNNYGIATVYYGDIEPDFDHGGIYGVRSMFGVNDPRLPNEWGAIGAWSWGLSRIMDYFETDTLVDASQVAISGVSRLGKTVLWAAAQDERFAMAIPIVSGEGGAAISRHDTIYSETVADLTDPNRYDYWYAPHYADYANNVNTLPVDGHMLVSLIAPRNILLVVGAEDIWSDPEGEWIAAKAAEPVFDLYGIEGLGVDTFVAPETKILGHMGFYMHEEGHTVTLKDYKVITEYMNLHFTNNATYNSVTITEEGDYYLLSNGILTAKVSKTSGSINSLKYKGKDVLDPAAPYIWWSHDVVGADTIIASVTIDPASNDGKMAEVSVKGISNGILMGHGPGAPAEGDLAVDIEIRYCLSRADQGIYTYCIFDHPAEYEAGDFTEARIASVPNRSLTHINVDEDRSGKFPLFNEGADKYVYAALQSENRAYGFTGPEVKMGFFMILPSTEFLSGGPSKAELLCHPDPETKVVPIALCYWRSSHYGGSTLDIQGGEEWSKVVGPILIYVNEGSTSEIMWDNAKDRLGYETDIWPYGWVQNSPYYDKDQRAEVSGKIILDDPFAPRGSGIKGRILAGLNVPPYTVSSIYGDYTVDWYNDAKHYQHWTISESSEGKFVIPNVTPGTYNLTIFADGVLGAYVQTGIEITDSGKVDLGDIIWTPVRHGWQVWEIGKADRTAAEFAGADSYFIPGPPLQYAEEFPNDIKYIIGKSKYAEDWYYAHMPHANDPSSEIIAFAGVSGSGLAAPRDINFYLVDSPQGSKAYIRAAVSGTGSSPIVNVSVNGTSVSQMNFGFEDGAMVRHQIFGRWREAETTFDASLLKKGNNTITLTVPTGLLNNGVIYDYIRLESDDSLSVGKYIDTNSVKLVENTDAFKMNMYPNPAKNILYLEYPDDLSGKFYGSILDITGKQVLSFDNYISGNDVYAVDIASLKPGNYIVVVKHNYNKIQKKLCIIR